MKVWIILLSILAAAATWWWNVHRGASTRVKPAPRGKVISKSIVAGIVVYFVLMSVALLYLMITNE